MHKRWHAKCCVPFACVVECVKDAERFGKQEYFKKQRGNEDGGDNPADRGSGRSIKGNGRPGAE